ncbi:MAG: NAD(P) transhydrogenase subunit alpha [Cyclobacteriaceae bacterium]|nr:NAD(P) transhydrogenase subunit alpha [Cyclobacteriaceae bacterium SS2]
MIVGVLKSTTSPISPLVPDLAKKYIKHDYQVILEANCGSLAHFPDVSFTEAGASIHSEKEILKAADIILTDTKIASDQIKHTKEGAIIIGRFNPLTNKAFVESLTATNRLIFSLDMVPRTSIAQSMDILSSLASLAGYKAVITAAEQYSGYFPMMSTAAGTVPPAKVLVLGAGVAGLQAIATARRLGAVVEAFDVRSAVKEEVQSLGAKFIEVEGSKEDKQAGGYAVQQSEEYIKLQKQLIHERALNADIVITTANIPGKTAPLLITKATVESMKPGSVIIDMASASGGNCELSEDNKTIHINDVKITGNSKLFESAPQESSRLYSTNLYNFITFLLKEGLDQLPFDHEIVQKTLLNQTELVSVNK